MRVSMSSLAARYFDKLNASVGSLKNPFERTEKVLAELELIRTTKDDTGVIAPEDGKLLRILIESSRARNVLEVGTGIGCATLYMAMGLMATGGKFIGLEDDEYLFGCAKENLRKGGVENVGTVIKGDAMDVLPQLKETFDFVFIDGRKSEYLSYFEALMPFVKVNGLITAHDVAGMSDYMQDFIDMLKVHPGLYTVLTVDETPTGAFGRRKGTGISISYKRSLDYDGIKDWDKRGFSWLQEGYKTTCAPLPFPYSTLNLDSDWGDRGVVAHLLVNKKMERRDVVGFTQQVLLDIHDKFSQTEMLLRIKDLSVYVFNNKESCWNRCNMRYPPHQYFESLVVHIRMHHRSDVIEIKYYPEKVLLKLDKNQTPFSRQLKK